MIAGARLGVRRKWERFAIVTGADISLHRKIVGVR